MAKYLLIFLALVACKADTPPQVATVSTSSAQIIATPVLATTPSPTPRNKTTVTMTVVGGTEAQRTRIKTIARNLETVINSESFKKKLLGNGKFFGSSASPASVYKKLMASDEFNKGKPDNVLQYEIHIVKLPKGVYGRMYWPKAPIYFNSMYLDNRKDSGLAGTLVHEQLHVLGYTHSGAFTPQRQFSIPYVGGTLGATIYGELYGKK